jgi:hypothetical protein
MKMVCVFYHETNTFLGIFETENDAEDAIDIGIHCEQLLDGNKDNYDIRVLPVGKLLMG